MATDRLRQAIIAIKSGDKATGKQILVELLRENQRNEYAWLWMTHVVDSNDDRIKCLNHVLKINPDNETAQRVLAKLQQKQSAVKSSPALLDTLNSLDDRTKIIVAVPLIIVMLCIGCSICGLAGNFFTNTQNQQVASQPSTPTEIPATPTLPQPTNTPVIRLPLPSDTPIPTNTIEPTKSPLSIEEYAKEMSGRLNYFGQVMSEFGELMNADNAFDEDWKAEVNIKINTIRAIHLGLTDIVPPPELTEYHETVLDGMGDCDKAMEFLASGIENQNDDDFSKATNLVMSCRQKLNAATNSLNEKPQQQVVVPTSTRPAQPTQAPQPTRPPQPTQPSQKEVCPCSSDSKNCDDFSSSASAQACYDYCKSIGSGDVHGLDRDKDGLACE